MNRELPSNFLWGNSVSSMQTEGGYNEGGKGKSVYDTYQETENTSDWKVGIDNYHHYTEDFDLMANQGMNCYRFQISWSRVNPDGDGEFNEEGIAYYDKFIDELIKRNIEPMICLYHFDMPLNLAEKYNGFISRHVVNAFVRYGKEMIDRFGDKVKYWITFNEQNLYMGSGGFEISGYLKGDKQPEETFKISHHIMSAHVQVSNYLHETTNAQIGGMLAYSEVYPASSDPKDIMYARQIDEFMNKNLLDVFVHGKYSTEYLAFISNNKIDIDMDEADNEEFSKICSDFIAFSYYQSGMISSRLVPEGTFPNYYLDFGGKENPFLKVNEWHWSIDPLGFRDVLTKTYNEYHLPMFPIENGIGVRENYDGTMIEDDYRIEYHRDHIQAMKDSMFIDGVDIIGYLGWGLIDILSSSGNMEKRYGMVYVNRGNHDLRDMKRIPKKSYEWFKNVIQSNGNILS